MLFLIVSSKSIKALSLVLFAMKTSLLVVLFSDVHHNFFVDLSVYNILDVFSHSSSILGAMSLASLKKFLKNPHPYIFVF